MFDTPTKRHQPNRSVSQPSAIGGQHQHQQHPQHQISATASASHLQNQRVAQIIQATGHNTSSPAFTNRFSSPAQNSHQFYASSAPSSSVALNVNQQNRPARPPVPLFSQGTGSVPQGQAKMIQDLDLEEFTAFEGGASTSAFSSPAMYGSASSSTTNMGTVSPQDLLIQEPFMSAPNSSALTALTSPSIYNESPEFNDSFDVSPNFGSSDFDTGSNDVWFPLFPQGSTTQTQQSAVDTSPAQQSDDLEVSEPTSQRRKSGGNSHSPSNRHSSVSGVNSRRRDKPLPPIIVDDPSDTVAMKRARNTLAARKSRERKAQRFDELEEKIAKLEAERDHWKKIALQGGQ